MSRAAIILADMGWAEGRGWASDCYWAVGLLPERRPLCEDGDFRIGDGVLRGDRDFLSDLGGLMGFSCACMYYKCSINKTYLDRGKGRV